MDAKPKLALIGYGNMGKEVEKKAQSEGYEIAEIFEIDNPISKNGDYEFDVAIDFSLPSAVYSNVETVANLKKDIVVGTTGWTDNIDKIKSLVEKSGTGFLYAPNFSIGAQFFMRIVDYASALADKIEYYDLALFETHHRKKADCPSGTAKTIADIILKNVGRKKEALTEPPTGKIAPESLHVASLRTGEVFGTHSLVMDSSFDAIELTHRAKSRGGFVKGAITAAQWLYGRKGFYSIDDMLNEIFSE